MTNEFILQDRIQKIRQIIRKYGEENFYISFSGGKDSTVLSALVDMALPNNKIPRVYANTGIEYRLIIEFVEKQKAKPHAWELIILKPTKPIKQTLEEFGYPFKSKYHARCVREYKKSGGTLKFSRSYFEGTNKWEQRRCPQILKYQFTEELSFKISEKCCDLLKKAPMKEYEKTSGRLIHIDGIMTEEGGQRVTAKCLVFQNNKIHAFHPLAPITKAWEEWLIKTYNIEICDIYKPPYNFIRTGCKGCPFAIELQNELDTLDRFFPAERKQCETIWRPVYEEYRRLGYRLRPLDEGRQMSIEEYEGDIYENFD